MLFRWKTISRMHRSIAVLAATLIGVVTAVMLVCAAALLIRFGGDDDGTWGAADVADALTVAVGRNDQGQLIVKQTPRLEGFVRNFPSFWYVVSDKTGEVSFGPLSQSRPPKGFGLQEGTSLLAYAIDGKTRSLNLRKMAAIRNTAVGEVRIETGGVAYTATQLMLGTLTDATIVALPILLILGVTAFAALVFVPALIAHPVRVVAAAAETIDGVPHGRRLPEEGTPAELLPLVKAFNRALSRIDVASKAQRNFLANAAHELRTPLQVPTALKHGCDIAFEDPGWPLWVQGSETAIGVALSNLIRNAVFHAESGQPILVEVAAPARLSVIDAGRGLQVGEPECLFDAFRRGNTRAEGVGLGLSIVFQVMTMHQGSIAIRETPGGGTTVELTFPIEQGHAKSTAPEQDELHWTMPMSETLSVK